METARILQSMLSIDDRCFSKETDTLKDKVAASECIWAKVIAHHNVSFKTSECLLKAVKAMLPDSEIAKHLKCARTKTTAILTKVIAPEIESTMIGKMQTEKFSLLTDDTTDITTKQQCCILVRLVDDVLGTVQGHVFKVLHLTSATGQNTRDVRKVLKLSS